MTPRGIAHLYLADCRDELSAEWGRISEKARKLSHKRNKLAHWTVLPAVNLGPTEEGVERFIPARLMPPIGSPKYYRETGYNPPGNRLTLVQVGHIEKAFCLLSERVRDFALRLAGEPELIDKDVLQALRLLASHNRLDPKILGPIRQHLASQE